MDIFINKEIWKDYSEDKIEELKNDIFEYYRTNGFPYFNLSDDEREKVFKKLQNFNIKKLYDDPKIKQYMLGLNLANHYMPHMWSTKCNRFKTPIESFDDDVLFKNAIDKIFKYFDNISDAKIRKVLSWTSGTQRVSNFRPTVAKFMYETYGGEQNLDFSSGYGGRLFGFLSSNKDIRTYVGIEPNNPTYNGLININNEFNNEDRKLYKRVELYNSPFEDLELESNRFDLSFSSPPYFNTEEYAYDDKQSFIRYPTVDEWKTNFLDVLIENNYKYLKKGGIFAINVANVKTYPKLEVDTFRMCQKVGFEFVKTHKMALSSLHSEGFKYEPIFVFKK